VSTPGPAGAAQALAGPNCFCRDCLSDLDANARRCAACGSPRLVRHRALPALALAHIDCDAFYATVEKRDNPEVADRPVIIGGGKRGVVSAACYIARTFGVRSAMPMFKALELCPSAVVIRPDMAKYVRVGREVRQAMQALTPLVEPLSIDEAFLDLSGTALVHGMIPAKVLARFAREVEDGIGITVSVGLSCNKFLAKIASDLDKPRGFAALDQEDARELLAGKPVGFIFGVGPATQHRLAQRGFRTIADLQRADEIELMKQFPSDGRRLWRLARGIDDRKVVADRGAKTISSETTFETDIRDYATLEKLLWRISEKVSARLKASELAGSTVTLKLKTADFRQRTRSQSIAAPTQLAGKIFAICREMLARETDGTAFRLMGAGVSALRPGAEAGDTDMLDRRSASAERAIDNLRKKFGQAAVIRGISYEGPDKPADTRSQPTATRK
jgi:DNA polymerase-4